MTDEEILGEEAVCQWCDRLRNSVYLQVWDDKPECINPWACQAYINWAIERQVKHSQTPFALYILRHSGLRVWIADRLVYLAGFVNPARPWRQHG